MAKHWDSFLSYCRLIIHGLNTHNVWVMVIIWVTPFYTQFIDPMAIKWNVYTLTLIIGIQPPEESNFLSLISVCITLQPRSIAKYVGCILGWLLGHVSFINCMIFCSTSLKANLVWLSGIPDTVTAISATFTWQACYQCSLVMSHCAGTGSHWRSSPPALITYWW